MKLILGLLIVLALLASAFFFSWRGVAPRPVTLRLISTTNDSTGVQTAYFCLSNQTRRPVEFTADATGLPCYSLIEVLPIDIAHRAFLVTNYNQQSFLTSKPETLPPGGSLTFAVRVPSGVTGAVAQLTYKEHKSGLEEMIRAGYARWKGRFSETYCPIEVRQPFAKPTN